MRHAVNYSGGNCWKLVTDYARLYMLWLVCSVLNCARYLGVQRRLQVSGIECDKTTTRNRALDQCGPS